MEYEITFMVRGSDLQPKSLVISLLSSSCPSKHSSCLTASVGLVPALWIIARQQQAALPHAGHQSCGDHKLPSLAGMINCIPKTLSPKAADIYRYPFLFFLSTP